MPSFTYKAYDFSGSMVVGEIDAATIELVKVKLNRDKLRPIEIKEVKISQTSGNFSFSKKDKVSLDDIEFITAELSLLLESGVKIDKALSVLASAKSQGALAVLLNNLSSNVRKGITLSHALEQYPNIFDKLYINLVHIGESSGNLPKVFHGLAQDLKYRKELKNKVIQATTYPAVILVVCILAVLFIFNFIVPKLTVMFDNMAELPIYTSILIGLSEWIQHYQFLAAGCLITTFFVIRWLIQRGDYSHRFDELMLRLPIIGSSIELIERIRFTSSMALMLSSGVKIDIALELATGSIKNQVISHRMSIIKNKVRKGESITVALKQSALFPDLFLSLLEVGEESGNMSAIFVEIANRSRTEFSNWTDKMTSLLEPMMILFMGAIVGSVVVVMLLSIVSVNDVSF